MNLMNERLRDLAEKGQALEVAIAGAGKMGKGLVNQMSRIPGMEARIVGNRTIEKAYDSLVSSGIKREDIVESHDLKEIEAAVASGKYVVTRDLSLLPRVGAVDAVVDATGNPEVGANLSLSAIENKKHIIMLNVEADSVVGPILYKYAREKGVVYTGTAGDEPGAVMELYDFAKGLGFDVLSIGKGKNNPVDLYANPDTMREKALEKGLKPSMLAGFVDGTNTMIEMTCMANATGFTPDIRGCHGVKSNIDDLKDHLKLKEDGGVLNNYNIVDYVLGIAPGVFVIFTTKLEEVHSQLSYLNMGPGPNYVLYRPYHLTSLETPLTIYDACINKKATIAPKKGQVADTIALAKVDLKKGDRLDSIGGYTFYGLIEDHKTCLREDLLPVGLIDGDTIMLEDVKKDQPIRRSQVSLNEDRAIFKLREIQDRELG